MKRADYRASIKATDDGNEFTALVSTFGGAPDLQGDVIEKGAFAESIAGWKASGDPVPLLVGHNWTDPLMNVGRIYADDLKETDAGLMIRGTLDLTNPIAQYVHTLLKERRMREFSIGYDVRDEKPRDDGATILKVIDLIEVSVVLKGANVNTMLLHVKDQSADDDAVAQMQQMLAKVSRLDGGAVPSPSSSRADVKRVRRNAELNGGGEPGRFVHDVELRAKLAALETDVSVAPVSTPSVEAGGVATSGAADAFYAEHRAEIQAERAAKAHLEQVKRDVNLLSNVPGEADRDARDAVIAENEAAARAAANTERRADAERDAVADANANEDATTGPDGETYVFKN